MLALDDMAAIGGLVRDIRTRNGLRQEDLAVLAKVGPRFIVELEKGKSTLQMGKLFQVLMALDIRVFVSLPIARKD